MDKLKKQNNLWSIFSYVVSGIIFIVGVIIDILIRCTDFQYWHVSNDYIGIVFGGLCTVAALGSAIQSIIIGAYSNKIYGFSVQELENFSSNKNRIKHSVSLSLGAIAIALPALALDFCSTISIITVIVVAYMVYSSIQIWQLLSDTKYQIAFIKNEVSIRGAAEPDVFFNGWFLELQSAIVVNDKTRQQTYIELIRCVVKKCNEANLDNSNMLAKYLAVAFDAASLHLGFVEAYQQVLCLNDTREQIKADLDSIIYKYIGTIQYCTASSIQSYQIANTIDDILENLNTEDFIKIRYVFSYYQSVVKNNIISVETRYQIIYSIIEKLCYLHDHGTGSVRGETLLYVAKYSIFENDADDERKRIFSIMINNLFNKNRYSRDECYWSVVSQLFRGLYFYSIYETEMLCSEFRKKLKTLYYYESPGKDNLKITLSGLVAENSEKIVKWLVNDSVYGDSFNLFDYFSVNSSSKYTIWEHENLLHFSFLVYLIFGYNFSLFPVDTIILNEEVDISIKQKICAAIVAMSNEHFRLNELAISKLHEMQTFFKNRNIIPDQYIVGNFEFFNEHLRDIETRKNQTLLINVSCNAEELFAELVPILEELEPFKFNSNIPLDNGKHIKIRPYLRIVTEKDIKYAAQKKLDELRANLNTIISETLPPVQIGFDSVGVKILLELLQKNIYLLRNYIYINDWAIKKETRLSEEFSKLEKAISEIPHIQSKDLSSYVFLRQQSIEFNLSIIAYQIDLPTDEQCEDFINGFKVAEGKYRIDGIIQDFFQAMKYVRENYRAESSEICIATNVAKNSGFKVKHW